MERLDGSLAVGAVHDQADDVVRLAHVPRDGVGDALLLLLFAIYEEEEEGRKAENGVRN